jgi:hypothetical protein
VVVDARGQPWLVDFDASEAMADQLALATDVAELLVSVARVVGAERALGGALVSLGPEMVDLALERDDQSRFSMQTRDALRSDSAVWDDLRRRAMSGRPPRSGSGPADPGPTGSAATTEEP